MLFAAEAAAIAATAARLPVSMRDDRRGAAAASVRALTVFLRHPLAPAAVPLGGLALGRLGRKRAPGALRRSVAVGIGVGAIALPMRAGAAVGAAAAVVAAGLMLTVEATAYRGIGGVAPRRAGDGLRAVIGLGLLGGALPWVLADVGIYAGDVPLLGAVVLSRQRLPAGAAGPAVHLGHHHGMDGALFAWTGLALSRQLAAVPDLRFRSGLAATLAGMIAYGSWRAAEDAWYEQVVKRGGTTRRLPSLVRDGRPDGRWAWAGVLAATWLGERCLRWEAAMDGASRGSPDPVVDRTSGLPTLKVSG